MHVGEVYWNDGDGDNNDDELEEEEEWCKGRSLI